MKKRTTLRIDDNDPLYKNEVSMYRELVIEAVRPYQDCDLFFSSGTDSSTVLAALLALGKKPVCFNFSTVPWDNIDRQTAEAITDHFKLRLIRVDRERTNDNFFEDVSYLLDQLLELPNYSPKRTTVLQCCHVTYRLCLSARLHGSTEILMGTGGVTDDTKLCAMAYNAGGDEAALPYRRYTCSMAAVPIEKEVNPINGEHWLARKLGVNTHDIFGKHNLLEFALSLPLSIVNYPRMKGIALRAFPEFWSGNELWWQNHTNMHVGCGMREWHNSILETPVNSHWFNRTAELYSFLIEQRRRLHDQR